MNKKGLFSPNVNTIHYMQWQLNKYGLPLIFSLRVQLCWHAMWELCEDGFRRHLSHSTRRIQTKDIHSSARFQSTSVFDSCKLTFCLFVYLYFLLQNRKKFMQDLFCGDNMWDTIVKLKNNTKNTNTRADFKQCHIKQISKLNYRDSTCSSRKNSLCGFRLYCATCLWGLMFF